MGTTDKQVVQVIKSRKGKDCICGDCIDRAVREISKKN